MRRQIFLACINNGTSKSNHTNMWGCTVIAVVLWGKSWVNSEPDVWYRNPFWNSWLFWEEGKNKRQQWVLPWGVLWYQMIPNEWDSSVLLRALLGDGSDIKNKFHKLRHACMQLAGLWTFQPLKTTNSSKVHQRCRCFCIINMPKPVSLSFPNFFLTTVIRQHGYIHRTLKSFLTKSISSKGGKTLLLLPIWTFLNSMARIQQSLFTSLTLNGTCILHYS